MLGQFMICRLYVCRFGIFRRTLQNTQEPDCEGSRDQESCLSFIKKAIPLLR